MLFMLKIYTYFSFNIFIDTIFLPANKVSCFDNYFISVIFTHSTHLLLVIQNGVQKVCIFSETITMKGFFPICGFTFKWGLVTFVFCWLDVWKKYLCPFLNYLMKIKIYYLFAFIWFILLWIPEMAIISIMYRVLFLILIIIDYLRITWNNSDWSD